MNLTISVDDEVLEKAQTLASHRGTTVQDLLRAHLEALVRGAPGEAVARELLSLMEEHGGRSGGRRVTRNEAYSDLTPAQVRVLRRLVEEEFK